MSGIRVIATGGTIDAEKYGPEPPETASFDANIGSRVLRFVKEFFVGADLKTEQWRQVDSKHITKQDLEELAAKINSCAENKIIITHGTDTLIENAKFIRSLIIDKNKTVFFVGSMLPLANGKTSDGWKNLEFAMKDILKSRAGTYVIGKEKNRYGRFVAGKFNPDQVHKDYEAQVFVRDVKKER